MNTCDEKSSLLIGISSCLLGNKVRYDGEHSRDESVLNSMSGLFEFVAFCPEVAIGLGVPRSPIQLVAQNNEIRVRGVKDTSQDVTDALSDYAKSIVEQLDLIDGYIFKSRSPSCGVTDVDVFDNKSGKIIDASAGQFAKTIMQLYPELPVEDEVRLRNESIRMDFIERVKSYGSQ